jgi:chromosome segregation ATPase
MQRRVTQIIKRSDLESLLCFQEKENEYKNDIHELNLKLDEKSKELHNYNLIIKQIENSITVITQNSENLKLSLSERDKTIESLKSELEKSNYNVKEHELKISELNKQKLSMEDELKVLDEEQQEIEEMLRIQVESNKDLKNQFVNFKKTHDNYMLFKKEEDNSLFNWYVNEIENLQSDVVILNKIICHKDYCLTNYEEIVKEHLFNCIIEKNNERDTRVQNLSNQIHELQNEIESEILKNTLMEEKNTNLLCLYNESKHAVEELTKKEIYYKHEIESLKQYNFNFEQTLIEDKNNAWKEFEIKCKEIQELEMSIEEKENLTKTNNEKIEELVKVIEHQKNKILKLSEQEEKSKIRIDTLESYCNESDDEITLLRNKIKDLTSKIENTEATKTIVSYDETTSEMKKKLEIQNGLIKSLKDSENALKENYNLMEEDVKEMLNSKNKLRNELSNVTQNYESIKVLWKQESQNNKDLKEKLNYLNSVLNSQKETFNNLRKNRHDREYLISILEREEKNQNEN